MKLTNKIFWPNTDKLLRYRYYIKHLIYLQVASSCTNCSYLKTPIFDTQKKEEEVEEETTKCVIGDLEKWLGLVRKNHWQWANRLLTSHQMLETIDSQRLKSCVSRVLDGTSLLQCSMPLRAHSSFLVTPILIALAS